MLDKKIIFDSFKRSQYDDSFIEYQNNKLLFEDKANILFLDTVIKRLQLAYKGRFTGDINGDYKFIYGYDRGTKSFATYSKNQFVGYIKDLIANNDMHRVSTNKFCDLALNEGLIPSYNEEIEEDYKLFAEENKLDELVASLIKLVDWSGSALLKKVKYEDEYSIDYVSIMNYFPVFSYYNNSKIIGYVEYQCLNDEKDKIYLFTEYTENSVNMFVGRFQDDGIVEITDNAALLQKVGMTPDDLRQDETVEGWEVFEVFTDRNFMRSYGSSNYNYTSKTCAREMVVMKTAEGQALDTFLKPTILADEGFFQRRKDDSDSAELRMQDDAIAWLGGTTEKPFFEVVKNEYNFDGAKSIKEQYELELYRSLSFNETVTGTSEKGYNTTSGKQIDMAVAINRANSLFNAVTSKLAMLINSIFKEQGMDLQLSYRMGSPLSLTDKEKIENTQLLIDSGLKSNVEAIADFYGIDMDKAQEMYEVIKEEKTALLPAFVED